MSQVRVAIVGAGVMGGNHARVVSDSPRAKLEVVIDSDFARAEQLAEKFGAQASAEVGLATSCDVAIVAAPTNAHHQIGIGLLNEGLPILMEKPISTVIAEVEMLCELSLERSVPLVCGFVERFNPVLDTATALLDEDPIHVVTMRHSPVAPRIMDSVVYDLLIHDIDLAIRLMSGQHVVGASGASWMPTGLSTPEIADCTLQFSGGGISTLSASRAGQRKLRSIQVFTSSTLVDLDLLRSDVTIFRNVSHEQRDAPKALTYRAETIIDIPFVRHVGEPLARQFDHFLDLIEDPKELKSELDGIIATHRVATLVEQACTATTSRKNPKAVTE